jgi:hypothetical protein
MGQAVQWPHSGHLPSRSEFRRWFIGWFPFHEGEEGGGGVEREREGERERKREREKRDRDREKLLILEQLESNKRCYWEIK